jgi:hypothetical protein
MGKTCLNRLIGRCENINRGRECKKDYDTAHHPNNYDCPNYHEANMLVFEVKNKNSKKYSLQRELLKKDSSLNELLNKLM